MNVQKLKKKLVLKLSSMTFRTAFRQKYDSYENPEKYLKYLKEVLEFYEGIKDSFLKTEEHKLESDADKDAYDYLMSFYLCEYSETEIKLKKLIRAKEKIISKSERLL